MTLRSQHACCQLSAQMPEGFCTFACIFAPLCGLYRIFASLRMRRAIANISPSFRGVCELHVQPVSRDKTSFVRLFCFNPPKGGKESKDNGQEKRTNGCAVMERLLRRSCSLTYAAELALNGVETSEGYWPTNARSQQQGKFLPRANVLGWIPETSVALSVINLHILRHLSCDAAIRC